jgi:F-type H+-transporting ATPase subunit alpha
MAQYNEVKAFAQFASDLDRATQLQLMRGQRLTELLKQDLVSPVDVVDQIVAIYAGTSAFLDEVKNSEVKEFEKGLLTYVHDKYPDVFETLKKTYTMTPELEETLKNAYREYTDEFKAKQASA